MPASHDHGLDYVRRFKLLANGIELFKNIKLPKRGDMWGEFGGTV